MSFRILSQDCRVDNNSYATGLNNNDLIIGPSGAGKTRGYVLPNILQCNESIIVADTKNSLRSETEAVLRQNGYQVYSLDLTGAGPSSSYDPLDYIRLDPRTERYNERDIMAVSAALIPIESPRDPFWELSARVYLESLMGYVLECLPQEEHTMDMVEWLDGRFWRQDNLLSLGGVSGKAVPPALGQFLHDGEGVRSICLRLDNDDTGRRAAEGIMKALQGRYVLCNLPPPQGKDYNDWLRMRLKEGGPNVTVENI